MSVQRLPQHLMPTTTILLISLYAFDIHLSIITKMKPCHLQVGSLEFTTNLPRPRRPVPSLTTSIFDVARTTWPEQRQTSATQLSVRFDPSVMAMENLNVWDRYRQSSCRFALHSGLLKWRPETLRPQSNPCTPPTSRGMSKPDSGHNFQCSDSLIANWEKNSSKSSSQRTRIRGNLLYTRLSCAKSKTIFDRMFNGGLSTKRN